MTKRIGTSAILPKPVPITKTLVLFSDLEVTCQRAMMPDYVITQRQLCLLVCICVHVLCCVVLCV